MDARTGAHTKGYNNDMYQSLEGKMKKFRIIFLFTISFISCTSNNYKQNSIPLSELYDIPDAFILDIEPQYQTTNYSCATVSLGMAIKYASNDTIVLSEEECWNYSGTKIESARKYGNDMNGLGKVCKRFSLKYKFINKMNIDILQYYIAHENPVILNIRPTPTQNYTHALLAIGYDKTKKIIYINDPSNIITQYSYDELKRHWDAWLYRPHIHSEQSGFVIMKE